MITIVNRKTYRGESIYVGRPSVLGNPYRIGPDGNRLEVIQKYRRFPGGKFKAAPELFTMSYIALLSSLRDPI